MGKSHTHPHIDKNDVTRMTHWAIELGLMLLAMSWRTDKTSTLQKRINRHSNSR